MNSEIRPPLQSEQELQLIERKHTKQSGPQEQEINNLKNTTAQRMFYLVVGIILLLLLIVGILGANVFHFM